MGNEPISRPYGFWQTLGWSVVLYVIGYYLAFLSVQLVQVVAMEFGWIQWMAMTPQQLSTSLTKAITTHSL